MGWSHDEFGADVPTQLLDSRSRKRSEPYFAIFRSDSRCKLSFHYPSGRYRSHLDALAFASLQIGSCRKYAARRWSGVGSDVLQVGILR